MENSEATYYFFVDKINEKFPGFSKLISKIESVFGNVETINTLDNIEEKKIIIPLGIVASHLFLKKYKKGNIAFIIDATTLGFLSIIKFYLRRRDFFNKHLIGAILRYVKYYFIELQVINNFDKIIVVSHHDANYLRKQFKCSNIEVITNGADIPELSEKREKGFSYTLGILSYWGSGSYKDVNWFITDYLPRLKKVYPQIRLITAGRGATDETLKLFAQNGIKHLGEIDNLWDFFNDIDIYITTLRKECGILNKVLDAMAHQKAVVGLEHNMYAFKNLKNGFFTYKNFDELVSAIETIKNDQKLVDDKIKNAYEYIISNHDWINNYMQLKLLVDNSFNKIE